MPRLSRKNQPSGTNNTTLSESEVEQLQKTIQRLKDENSQLKVKLGLNYSRDARVVSYLKDIVSKSNPDMFDGYSGDASNKLSTFTINVSAYAHPVYLQSWIPESAMIFYEMWETMMKVGQRGLLLQPYRGSYDPSKTKGLKPPKTMQELSKILHRTIEKPAAQLVNAVEQKLSSHSNKTCVWYRDRVPIQIKKEASKSFAKLYPKNAKMLYSTSHSQPDACFFGITYSLMVKYNLKYAYATTGRCWLILCKLPDKNNTLLYEFFELKGNTELPQQCQNTDYHYLKETAFVKVACLLLDIVNDYRKYHMDIELFEEDSQSDTTQESEDPSPKAKPLHSADETNSQSSTSHRPVKKQKTEHYKLIGDNAFHYKRLHPRSEYCTQKCLLGLKSNAPMHQECPNYAIHKKHSDSDLHPIRNTDLGMLFYKQLENEEGGFERIRKYKWKEVKIFLKITVYPYGYTFVGKGGTYSNHRYTRNEIYVYNKLEKIQGEWIPVYLDYVRFSDDVRVDRLDDEGPRIYIMIFVSYAGEKLDCAKVGEEKIKEMENRLLDLGVIPGFGYKNKIHWSKELKHEMLGNLESSEVI